MDFRPLQFSKATTTAPASSMARMTFRAAPPEGEPVTKIRGFLPSFLPAAYSASIWSARSLMRAGRDSTSMLKPLP